MLEQLPFCRSFATISSLSGIVNQPWAALTVASGRVLSEAESIDLSRVVVLAATLVTDLYGTADPLGETLRANQEPCTVIGVLKSTGVSGEAGAWPLWVMDADGSAPQPLPVEIDLGYTFGVEQVVNWGPYGTDVPCRKALARLASVVAVPRRICYKRPTDRILFTRPRI